MSTAPPGPRGLPLLGSFFPFHAGRRLWFLEQVVRAHGDLCGFRVLWTTFVVVNEPQHALAVLANRDQAYSITFAPELRALELIRPPAEGLVRGGKAPRGSDSSSRAQLEQLAFDAVSRSVHRWREAGGLEVIEAGGMLAVELTLKALFGLEVERPEEYFFAIRGALTEGHSERGDSRKQREERRELFARLKQRAVEQGPQDEALPLRREGFSPLMLATVAPMSAVLTWGLLLLAESRERVERAASDSGWRRAFVRELLRHRPPAWGLARVAERAHELGGYHVPRGARVVVSPYLLHHHPGYWDAPDEFRPERFLEEAKPGSQIFLPFGGGAKSCPASTVALVLLEGAFRAIATACSLRTQSLPLPRPSPSYALIPERPTVLTMGPPAG